MMKLEEALSPEYQRKYDKACRDWKAGRNLQEAASIVYGTSSRRRIAVLIKQREAELAAKRSQSSKLRIEGLGLLTRKGEGYVGKANTLLFLKKKVQVLVQSESVDADAVAGLWKRFRNREKTLLRELQTAVSKYYRSEIKSRLSMATESSRKPMRRNADIWESLGEPELVFLKRGKRLELLAGWAPEWEEEHGVYAFFDSQMSIRRVGVYR